MATRRPVVGFQSPTAARTILGQVASESRRNASIRAATERNAFNTIVSMFRQMDPANQGAMRDLFLSNPQSHAFLERQGIPSELIPTLFKPFNENPRAADPILRQGMFGDQPGFGLVDPVSGTVRRVEGFTPSAGGSGSGGSGSSRAAQLAAELDAEQGAGGEVARPRQEGEPVRQDVAADAPENQQVAPQAAPVKIGARRTAAGVEVVQVGPDEFIPTSELSKDELDRLDKGELPPSIAMGPLFRQVEQEARARTPTGPPVRLLSPQERQRRRAARVKQLRDEIALEQQRRDMLDAAINDPRFEPFIPEEIPISGTLSRPHFRRF